MRPPAPQTSPPPPLKKKKKKKKRPEVLEGSLAPPPQTSPPPSLHKKKKKKRRSEVLEESVAPPPQTSPPPSLHKKKKKKRRSEVLEESVAPPPQTSPPPSLHKKKKKKKKRSEVLEESVAPPPQTSPPPLKKKKKKKRRSEVPEGSLAPPPQSSPPSHHKKKKKRRSEVLDESVAPPPQTSPPPLHKKKKRRSEVLEESVAPPPQTSPPPSLHEKKKKRRSEVLEESVAPPPQTSPPPSLHKKKKKKRRSEVLEESVAPPLQTSPPPSLHKKKKRRSEVLEESVAPPPQPSPPPASQNKKRSEVLEEAPAPQTSPQKKKKRRRTSEILEEAPAPPPQKKKKRSGGLEELPPPHSFSQDQQLEEQCKEIWLDSALMQELQEFFPNVKMKSVNQIRKLLRYDLSRFRVFKQQGLSHRKGRCSELENRQISENVSDFMALTGIPSAQQLLFPQRFKDQQAEIKKLKVQHQFLERIAEGIPRTCEQVYIRARKLFDQRNHMGRFSEEEICTLQKLHKLHGNDWKTISEKMERSVYAVEKRFRTLSSRHGSWAPDEESRLKKAVRTHLETLVRDNPDSGMTKEQLCVKLPWKMISEQVQTRAWTQCRLKWFSILQHRLNPAHGLFNRGINGVVARIQLIDTMYQMNVDDLADVDWNVVANCIGDVSPTVVQKTFHRMKFHKVPHWSTLSFGEILDFLHDRILPQLEDRLRCYRDKLGRYQTVEVALQAELRENGKQLSFIFTDEEEEEEQEVDNSGLPIEIQLQTLGSDKPRPPL